MQFGCHFFIFSPIFLSSQMGADIIHYNFKSELHLFIFSSFCSALTFILMFVIKKMANIYQLHYFKKSAVSKNIFKKEVTRSNQSESSFWCRRLMIRKKIQKIKVKNVFKDSSGLIRLILRSWYSSKSPQEDRKIKRSCNWDLKLKYIMSAPICTEILQL